MKSIKIFTIIITGLLFIGLANAQPGGGGFGDDPNYVLISKINLTPFHPSAGSIIANTSNNIIGCIRIMDSDVASTLLSISVNTSGTYVASDIQSSGFKVWFNSANTLSGAVQLGANQAAVSSGGTISVSGLSQALAVNSTNYIIITANISVSAIDANTIGITSTAFNNFAFSNPSFIQFSGTNPISASGLQSIISAKFIRFAASHPVAGNIFPETNNNIIASILLFDSLSPASLTSITVNTAGSYAISDIKSNGFKFWINSNNTLIGASQIGSSLSVVNSGGLVSLTGLSQNLVTGNNYILITADISQGAILGNTIGIAATSFSNFSFNLGTTKLGNDPVLSSNLQTIVRQPSIISISSIHPSGSYLNTNSSNNILASYQVIDSLSNALLSSLSFTTQGTYTSADIQSMGLKCWLNSTNDLVGATQIGTNQPVVASGGVITLSGLSQNIPIGTSYILVTCDISNTAENGNTIGLASTPIGNFSFSGSPVISGASTMAASNLFTINATGPVKMQYRISNSYKENFSDVANWTNGFASGLGAGRWAGVTTSAGTIPNAKAITVSTANFQTSSSGAGMQRGSLTGNVAGTIAFLSLGNTDNTSACAVDFFMDYTRRNADSLIFDAATVFNGVGNRNSTLRVYWSIDGTNFTELTGANLPYTATNNVANSANIRAKLPTAFNNVSTCRLRFYYHNGTGGTTSSRPKISIDNVQVSALCPIGSSSTSITSCTPYTWNGITYNASGIYNKTFTGAGTWGCDSIATLNLNISPLISYNPFQDTIKACGTSYTLNAGSGFVSYVWNTGATSATISPSNANWYKVTVNNGACTISDSVLLSLVNADITNRDTTICLGKSVTLNVTGSGVISSPLSYLWSNSSNNQNITVSPALTTMYYCTVSNGINSCMDSVKVDKDNFNPNLFVQDTLKVCGTSYTLNADSGYASYVWNTGSTARSLNTTTAGWKNCTVSNGLCSSKDSVLLSLVNANITNRDTTICLGKSITLNVVGSGVISGPLSYLWSNAGNTQNITVSPALTTTYYCTVSNGINSCMDSVNVIKDNFNPNLFLQDTLKVCGTSYTLNADSGYVSYVWNTGSTARSLNTTTAGWKNCTVSNGLCSSKDSVLLSLILANIINNDTIISAGATFTLRATGTGIISNPLTYLWSSGANTQNITVSPTQKTTYYCTVSNGVSSCRDSVKIGVNVSINLKMFFEAFYENGRLKSSLNNADGSSDIGLFDTVQIMLYDSMSNAIVYSIKSIADTGGICQILIPSAYANNSYYIGIKHRGSIETWSNSSVLLNNGIVYNFTNAASKAYGANLKDDGTGVFLIYNGDINQDGSVDFNDYPDLDIGSYNGDFGYFATDLNGDASVDFNDYPILDINSYDGIIALTPIVYNGFIRNKSMKKSLIAK
jgi:hypothetical protein